MIYFSSSPAVENVSITAGKYLYTFFVIFFLSFTYIFFYFMQVHNVKFSNILKS